MSTVMEHPGGDVTENGRGGRGLVMVGAAVGAVVLIGGGAYLGMKALASDGGQPDTVLPASAAFYARFDVDPSAGQKVAAVRFFEGLDEQTKARLDEGEWREWVWEQVQEDGDVPADLDFDTDIEPWLGDRAGVAVVPRGEEQEPIVAVALQVKDGEQALATLDRVKAESAGEDADEQVAYYLDDDYVIFTQADMLADLQAAAEQGTLADHEVYADDVAELGDAGIASLWADGARVGDLAPAALANPALGAAGGLDATEALGEEADLMTGRVAATMRLSADSIEIHGVTRGVENMAMPTGGDTARLVNQLPADTAAALSLENGADWVQAAWDYYAAASPEAVQGAADAAAEQGFTLPDDLKTVLGDSMALAVGPGIVSAVESMSETSPGLPALPIGYRVSTDTTALVTMLSEAGVPSAMLPQRTDDGVLTIGVDQAYVDALAAPEGTLGDDATYRAAVADAQEASSVLFVNVNPFEEYYLTEVSDEQARTSLESLAAIGFSTTVDDASQTRFTMRLVADEE